MRSLPSSRRPISSRTRTGRAIPWAATPATSPPSRRATSRWSPITVSRPRPWTTFSPPPCAPTLTTVSRPPSPAQTITASITSGSGANRTDPASDQGGLADPGFAHDRGQHPLVLRDQHALVLDGQLGGPGQHRLVHRAERGVEQGPGHLVERRAQHRGLLRAVTRLG